MAVVRWLQRHWRHTKQFWAAAGRAGADAKWEARYAFRYVLVEYPHRIAYIILGLGCFLALGWVAVIYTRLDDSQATQRAQATVQARQQAQIAVLVERIQQDRKRTSAEFCSTINDLSGALRGLIIGGAKASKPFDRVYRQFGFPPYKERIAQAHRQAALIPHVNCAEVVRRIEGTTPPQPPPGGPPH